MAHYDVHGKRGHDGYDIKEPIYGGRPAVVAYSAMSESYVASSEQVVSYGDYNTRPDQFWPRGSTHAQLKKGGEYDHSPRFSHSKGSPRKTLHGANSPPAGHFPSVYAPHLDSPRKNHSGVHQGSPRKSAYGPGPHDSPRKNIRDGGGGRFGSDEDSSDDEELECRDGVCYPKPKHGGYPAGTYPVQRYADHPPKRDPHHQTSNTPNTYGSHSYDAPAHTKPTDAYYDRYADYKNEPYAVPAPIKTRPDHGESSPVSAVAQWTPFATTSPRKPHQGRPDIIDSSEAQRRYGNAPPQRRYGAAIDSETAARKYGGVFVK